ncbi:MAG: hypothetical protein HQ546_10030 [Planctomycetes bacterium]|nr:hypothetical protein [Planctomycetota bacterium]
MIHHKDRKDTIYFLTLDPILATDVVERLGDNPRTRNFELIVPGDGKPGITVKDVAQLTRDTICSRVLILDVRSHSLPRLQEAYNRVVGFNRGDLNERCYTVLIGDGPPRIGQPNTSIEVFAPFLAKHRLDYSPAVFFYDPFVHYEHDETFAFGLDGSHALPNAIPSRLAKAFKEDEADVEQVRQYFRAVSVPADQRAEVKNRRLAKLTRFYKKRIISLFPADKNLGRWLRKEGYSIEGETLRLNLYPLFFEEWVLELMYKAKYP